jgi:hypothetical protein
LSISFHYSTCLSSIFSISFHNFLPYFPFHFTFQLAFLPYFPYTMYQVRVITVFTVFWLLTDFVCLYTYEF